MHFMFLLLFFHLWALLVEILLSRCIQLLCISMLCSCRTKDFYVKSLNGAQPSNLTPSASAFAESQNLIQNVKNSNVKILTKHEGKLSIVQIIYDITNVNLRNEEKLFST